MTTPLGDTPDWQTLVTPNILAAFVQDLGGGLFDPILSLANPFRIWGAWVSFRFSSNSSYVAGLGSCEVNIQDGAGHIILLVSGSVRVASQVTNDSLSISIPGFTPGIFSGSYEIAISTASTPANTDFKASAGIYYSQP